MNSQLKLNCKLSITHNFSRKYKRIFANAKAKYCSVHSNPLVIRNNKAEFRIKKSICVWDIEVVI